MSEVAFEGVDPRFSRKAARVVGSPYFSTARPDASIDDLLRLKHDMVRALIAAKRYEDLTGEAKETYDAAAAYNLAERAKYEESRPGHSNDFGMPVLHDGPLTDAEQAGVDQAIAQAKTDGRQDVVEWLKTARKDSPSAVRHLLAEITGPADEFDLDEFDDGDEEDEDDGDDY
jgi:hypothetical protein